MVTSLVILTLNIDVDAIVNDVIAGIILLLIQYLCRKHHTKMTAMSRNHSGQED